MRRWKKTLGIAAKLFEKGALVVGIPKTIDKDLAGTDYTPGPACDLSLVNMAKVLGKLNTVDVERHYDTERYHLKIIGM